MSPSTPSTGLWKTLWKLLKTLQRHEHLLMAALKLAFYGPSKKIIVSLPWTSSFVQPLCHHPGGLHTGGARLGLVAASSISLASP